MPKQSKIFLISVLLCFLSCLSHAQEAILELGFGGDLVADTWNPIRLEFRDRPNVTLSITIDQGNIREGNIPIIYQVNLARQQGLSIFEDDIYLPAWRSLSWRVEGQDRVISSGSIARRNANPNLMSLVVSNSPSTWVNLFTEGRFVASGSNLPTRVPSYQGVRHLILDGTVAAPKREAIISAAVSGATVILFEPLPSSYANLLALVPNQELQLGAGRIVKANRNSILSYLESTETRFQIDHLADALITDDLRTYPPLPPLIPILVVASIFSMLVLLSFRFLSTTASLTVLLMSLLTSILAWTWLKPTPSVQEELRTLVLSSDDLALEQSLHSLVSLPSVTKKYDFAAFSKSTQEAQTNPDSYTIELARWSNLLVFEKPSLLISNLKIVQQNGGYELRNSSSRAFTDIFVIGQGWQPDLAADSAIILSEGSSRPLSSTYQSLAEQLPQGTVLASSENRVYAVLRAN